MSEVIEQIEHYGLSQKDRPKQLFSKVGIVGCGTVGQNIAMMISQKELEVVFIELSDEKINYAMCKIELELDNMIEHWGMTPSEKRAILSRIKGYVGYQHLKGCDLVIEFPLIEELNILRLLDEKGIDPIETVPVNSPLLKPVNLFQVKDYGKYLMIRAANMKLTIDKDTQIIVNISGGGCPDVPFLAQEMVGKYLHEAPDPENIGHTLCGYALKLAYEEMKKQCLQ